MIPRELQARYGLDVVKPEDNIRPVTELQEGLVPYAVVLSDGTWIDRGTKSDADWVLKWQSLCRLRQHALAIATDCHS